MGDVFHEWTVYGRVQKYGIPARKAPARRIQDRREEEAGLGEAETVPGAGPDVDVF
jgi:hypothetical protein